MKFKFFCIYRYEKLDDLINNWLNNEQPIIKYFAQSENDNSIVVSFLYEDRLEGINPLENMK